MMDVAELEMKQYLARLRAGLTRMSLTEREEIVQEITAHIRECAEIPGAEIAEILARLGSAEELAAQYRDGVLLSRASRSISPLLLLRGLWFFAQRGLLGVVAFTVALFGYSIGGGLTLTTILKPFLPARVGLWVGSGQFIAGFSASPLEDGRELLGWWYIPAALATASVILWLTTWATRRFLSVVREWRRAKLAQSIELAYMVGR